MKTVMARKEDIAKNWYVVDGEGMILGRFASQVAAILRGKHKPVFTPSVDMGDFVIVINAEKVRLTGKKVLNKVYYHHSGYPGGLKATTAEKLIKENPEKVVRMAIWGMLPKNKLGRTMRQRLKVYRGNEHPHSAQKPQMLKLKLKLNP
ncbi:MAG: 50S ribosomal protein L13 [Nitrospirota bacterium]